MTSPEPASVTASRQLAADSRDRERQVRRPQAAPPGQRRSRETAAGTAARPTIRPLGRPAAEHLDVTASPDDGAAAGWRLGRTRPVGDVGRNESVPAVARRTEEER